MLKNIIFLILIFFLSSCVDDVKVQSENMNRKGDVFFARREFKSAINAWKKASLLQPDNYRILKKIGNAYLKRLYPLKAACEFRKVLEIKPDDFETHLEVARIDLAFGNIKEATETCRKLTKVLKGNPNFHLLYGDLLIMDERYKEAEFHYRQAILQDNQLEQALTRLAVCLLARGEIKESLDHIKTVQKMNLQSAEIQIQLYHYWKFADDLKKAKDALKRAIEIEPEDLKNHKLLAQLYYDSGKYGKAQEIVEYVLLKIPDNSQLKKFLMEIMICQDKVRDALAIMNQLKDEKSFDYDFLKGKFYLYRGEYVFSISSLKAASKKSPHTAETYYLCGIAYLCNGQTQLGLQSFNAALAIRPLYTDAKLGVAAIYYKLLKYDFSLEHALEVCAEEPENYRAQIMAGNSYTGLNRYEEAMAHLEIARKIKPESPLAPYFLAICHEFSGNNIEALEIYKNITVKWPELADAAWRYCSLLQKTGNPEAAMKFIKNAIGLSKQNELFYLIAGELQMNENNFDKAMLYFKQAINIAPDYQSSYLCLSALYKRLNLTQKQIETLKLCILNIPHEARAYLELAGIYMQNNDLPGATSLLEDAALKLPDSPLILSNLSWLYLEQDTDLEKAFLLAQNAYDLMPDHPAITDTLGRAYYKKGILTRAAWLFADAASLNPVAPLPFFHLGLTFDARGKASDAIRNLEKAVDLNLSEPHLEEARNLLAQLKKDPDPVTQASEKNVQGMDFTGGKIADFESETVENETESPFKNLWKN